MKIFLIYFEEQGLAPNQVLKWQYLGEFLHSYFWHPIHALHGEIEMFTNRFTVYGSSNQSIWMKDKDFLHSFLRKEDAMSYIKDHGQRLMTYECYDVYVAGNIIERVYVQTKENV